jgi:nucleotide-binding universal stress UspA family protein
MPPTEIVVREEQARAYLEDVASRLTAFRVKTWIRAGDPVEEIGQTAQELGVDGVAMTTHARRGLPRLLLGSVAEAVLRKSTKPLFFVRPGLPPPEGPFRRILVPLDGSDEALVTIPLVKGIALANRAELILFEVVVPVLVPEPMAGPVPLFALPDPPDPGPKLAELARELAADGITSRALVTHGYAAPEIARFARDSGADLIAMASHVRHGVDRFLTGNTATYVLRHVNRPLLLVPAGDGTQRPPSD